MVYYGFKTFKVLKPLKWINSDWWKSSPRQHSCNACFWDQLWEGTWSFVQLLVFQSLIIVWVWTTEFELLSDLIDFWILISEYLTNSALLALLVVSLYACLTKMLYLRWVDLCLSSSFPGCSIDISLFMDTLLGSRWFDLSLWNWV